MVTEMILAAVIANTTASTAATQNGLDIGILLELEPLLLLP
jgi:hypothetical protein